MKRSKIHFQRITCILAVLLLFLNSCSENFDSSIPYVQVSKSINLINYNDLTVAGNAVYFSGGYGGIIVLYNGIQYYAYDAACPYEASTSCTLSVEGGIGTCSCCGSTYNLWDGGYVMSGPSTEQLLQYQVTTGDNRIYITN